MRPFKNPSKIVKIAKSNSLGISVQFATCSTMNGKKRKFTTVISAVFVELEEGITFFTVTLANVVLAYT